MDTAAVVAVSVRDVRFPTSRHSDGSDAMHQSPDYSAAYVSITTDAGVTGDGICFTLGRGNEVCCAAVRALAPVVVGLKLARLRSDFGGVWRSLTSEGQVRWIGPEKGALHLATAALVNALWDLWAKFEGKPVWKLVADLTPEQLVSCLDFRHITDALTPEEALAILKAAAPSKAAREAEMRSRGFPAYTTSTGWIGYDDDKVRRLCREWMGKGFDAFKMKVGISLQDDMRRAALLREEIGWSRTLMMDANQVWGVEEAIANMQQLKQFNPLWIEEPTHPDDVLGHQRIYNNIHPVGVATGEHCSNRVIFKQYLQAKALKFLQSDVCRLGGLNEYIVVLLMAKKFGVPVCPHAGGVGLCELAAHCVMIDFICIAASTENRVGEYVDHLHEHFEDPCVVQQARYMPPLRAGFSTTIKPASLDAHEFPTGREWARAD